MIELEQQHLNSISGGTKVLTLDNLMVDLNGYVCGAILGLFLHYEVTGLPFWAPYTGPAIYAMWGGTMGALTADYLYENT